MLTSIEKIPGHDPKLDRKRELGALGQFSLPNQIAIEQVQSAITDKRDPAAIEKGRQRLLEQAQVLATKSSS